VIKSSIGERLDASIHRLFPFLFRRHLDPNALTVCGALVSLAAAVTFAFGHFAAAGLLVLLGGFFDLVDGVVARHQGSASRFGAFLDSTLDRFVDMVLLLGICVHFAARGDAGTVLLAGVALIASVLVSYAKARAELVLPHFDVGLFERGERVGLLAAGAILGFLVPALWIIAIGSAVTVAQRFAAAYREMEKLDEADCRGLGENAG
jgi:CDP-diacylglycerol--glycerol-3-phosphate 3-phosphatidyltransferase